MSNTGSDGYAKGVKGEIDQRPKRFYSEVTVAGQDGNWIIQLDGRPLRTPEKKHLALPNEQLADLIAEEWRSQGERIDLQSMFNTRLANVVVDRTPFVRAELGQEASRYAHTDLVCHLAEGPATLRERQEAAWAPLRDWAASEMNIALCAVEGVIAAPQPDASIEAVRKHAASLDDWRLTALVQSVTMLGSAVLGVAVERRRLSAAEAFEISRIDEDFQASQWGEDMEAKRRADRTREEARALDRWLDALPL